MVRHTQLDTRLLTYAHNGSTWPLHAAGSDILETREKSIDRGVGVLLPETEPESLDQSILEVTQYWLMLKV